MKIRVLALLMALVLSLSSVASAAQPAKEVLFFEVLSVEIMPEYDQDYPQALVVFQGALVNKGQDPWTGEITFRAPKNASISSACELSADPLKNPNAVHTNMVSLGKAKITEQGDYKEITYTTEKVIEPGKSYPFHMEWYYPAVTGGPNKSVDFKLALPFGADKIALEVLEPARSSNYKSSLQESASGSVNGGLTAHRYELPAMKAGELLSIQFSYNKADNNKSVVGSTASRPAAGSNLSLAGNQTVLWVALGMVIILGFFIFYGGSSKKASVSSKPNKAVAKGKANAANLTRVEEEKKKARKLLLEGKISEGTYRELIRDLNNGSR